MGWENVTNSGKQISAFFDSCLASYCIFSPFLSLNALAQCVLDAYKLVGCARSLDMCVKDFVIRIAFAATVLNNLFLDRIRPPTMMTYFAFRVLFLIKTPSSSSPFLGFSSKQMLGYVGDRGKYWIVKSSSLKSNNLGCKRKMHTCSTSTNSSTIYNKQFHRSRSRTCENF